MIPEIWKIAFTSWMHTRYGLMPAEYMDNIDGMELAAHYEANPDSALEAAEFYGSLFGFTRIDQEAA